MLTSALLTLITLSQFVVGQTVTPLPNTPQCLLTCSMQFCPTSQLQCLCVDQYSNITICALNTCDSADQATAGTIAAQVCAGVMSSSVSTTPAMSSVASSTSISTSTNVVTSTIASSPSSSPPASKSASASGSAATSSIGVQSEATHDKPLGFALLGIAGIMAGFAFF